MHNLSTTWRISNIALLLILLAGCAPWGGPRAEPTVITFACEESQRAIYRAAAREFHQANPDIKVQLVSIPVKMPPEELEITKKVRQLASMADTFLWSESAVEGGPKGLLLDLSPLIEADKAPKDEDFLPGLLERFRWKGGTWGLPAGVDPFIILYEKEAFQEAGIEPPTQGWMWEELLNKAKQLTEREGEEVLRYGFADLFRGSFRSAVIAHSGRLVDHSVEPPMPMLDDPRTVEAVRWYVDLILTHKVMPDLTQEEATTRGLSPSLEGKAAMWVSSAQSVAGPFQMRRKGQGIAPLPEGSHIIVSGYFISSGTSHPQEAWRWIRFLSEHIPPPGQLPARRELISGSTYAQEVGEETLDSLLYSVEHALPPIRPVALMGLAEDALESIFAGEEPEEALAKAQEEAMDEISESLEKRTPEPVVVATPRPEVEATITFWTLSSAGYEPLVGEFREGHPEIEVEVAWLFEFYHDFLSPVKAGKGDCFVLPIREVDEEAKEALLSLQPFVEADPSFPLDDYYPQALEEARYEGKLWGLPASGVIFGLLYYDKSLFEEAGLSYPHVDWAWEDFFETAKELSKGKGAGKKWGLGVREGGLDLVLLLEAMSGGLVDDLSSPRAFRFHSPEAIEAAHMLANLGRAGAIRRVAVEDWGRGFPSERVGMWAGRFYFPPELAAHLGLGIASLPKGRRGIAEQGFSAYYISADTPYPEACWKWIKFLSDRIMGWRVPPRRSLVESDAFCRRVGEEVQAAYLEALEYEDSNISRGLEGLPQSGRAYRFLEEALEGIIWEEADVREALAEAQYKAEAYVDCLGRSDDPKAAAEACFEKVDAQ